MNGLDAPLRPWPISPRPMAGETIPSYLGRLAKANRLDIATVYEHVAGYRGNGGVEALLNPEAAWRLSVVSGRSVPKLRRALPALSIAYEVGDPRPRARFLPARQRLNVAAVCRQCAAHHGGPLNAAATATLPDHVNMCPRHHTWLRDSPMPLDTSRRPEIARAQRRHLALARAHGAALAAALEAADSLVELWSRRNHVLNHRVNSRAAAIIDGNSLHPRYLPHLLPRYPDAVALTGLFLDHPEQRLLFDTWHVFPIDPRHVDFAADAFARLGLVFDPDQRQAEIAALSQFAHNTSVRRASTNHAMETVLRIINDQLRRGLTPSSEITSYGTSSTPSDKRSVHRVDRQKEAA